MVEVVINLLPHGNEEKRRRLGYGVIANDMTGSPEKGNYTAVFYSEDLSKICHVYLKDFPRKKSGAWGLVKAVIKKAEVEGWK